MEAEEVYKEKKAQIEWEKEASIKLYRARGRYSKDMRLNNEGYAYLRDGDYEKAREYFKRSLEINPNNPYAILNMGVLNEREGNIEEAIRMYEKVIQLNTKDRANESTDVMKRGQSLIDIARENIMKLKGNQAQ
jgi:general secretion pathway protein D